MNITKARLAKSLMARLNFTKFSAETLADNFFEQICSALIRGNAVKIQGFGNFTFKDKKMPDTGSGPSGAALGSSLKSSTVAKGL